MVESACLWASGVSYGLNGIERRFGGGPPRSSWRFDAPGLAARVDQWRGHTRANRYKAGILLYKRRFADSQTSRVPINCGSRATQTRLLSARVLVGTNASAARDEAIDKQIGLVHRRKSVAWLNPRQDPGRRKRMQGGDSWLTLSAAATAAC